MKMKGKNKNENDAHGKTKSRIIPLHRKRAGDASTTSPSIQSIPGDDHDVSVATSAVSLGSSLHPSSTRGAKKSSQMSSYFNKMGGTKISSAASSLSAAAAKSSTTRGRERDDDTVASGWSNNSFGTLNTMKSAKSMKSTKSCQSVKSTRSSYSTYSNMSMASAKSFFSNMSIDAINWGNFYESLFRLIFSTSKNRIIFALFCFTNLTAIKLLYSDYRTKAIHRQVLSEMEGTPEVQAFADRENCQIIYVLGVEGSIHHGFTPILQTLAGKQIDPKTDTNYVVKYADRNFRSALFGFGKESRTLDNPTLVRQVIRKICPHNHKKHVIIEDSSFPSGLYDDRRTYRIHRQQWWSSISSSMEEIALSEVAQNHPTNLRMFYESFSEYADIKFVVLHRSYVEIVASTFDQDRTPVQHSNVIRGFMLLLRRFLDSYPLDSVTGQQLWTLVCVERLAAKFYEDDAEKLDFARKNIVQYLADFLGWPEQDCPECFDHWEVSTKQHVQVLGEETVTVVLDHMRKLGGIWPPSVEDALPEQKCSL